ncbi:hypothetical protein [Agromyces sp. GXQ0307]|uniref:hypothetical protein n=1 Tax=Agromyces sp. GXQ0307 TaxID=3377835 RepID=UPI00383AC167
MFGSLFNVFSGRSDPDILEIRIHGVQNTPPAEMLETAPDKIEKVFGDDLGSFWRKRGERPERGIRSIEAFSWGAQARTGGGALAAIGRAFVHVGWFLLLPYALANLGYWTRRIDPQPGMTAGTPKWNGDFGAATVRVFGLLLTLIAVAAFCSVAIDLVGIQCFRDGQVCAALPSVFDGLVDLERDRRAALFGLAPIATVVVLYVIARRGRVAYEERVKQFGTGLDLLEQERNRPLLATRGFWTESRIGQTSEWLHVSGAIALVLFLLALDSAYLAVDDCWTDGSSSITGECLAAGFGNPVAAWFAIGAAALLVVIVVLVALASHTTSDRRTTVKRMASMTCLVASIAGYGVWTWLAFRTTEGDGGGKVFLGLIGTPIALIVLALFLALAGAGWKNRSWARRVISAILLVGGAALLLGSHARDGDERWLWVGGAALCVLLHLVNAWTTPANHRFQAWRGQGAAVAMLLALFASMALSSLLVLGVASWLGTSTDSADTSYIWRTPPEPQPELSLDVPDAYERFAVVLTAIAVLMIVLIVAALLVNMVRFVRFSLPALAWSTPSDGDDERASAEERGGLVTPDPTTYAPRYAVPEARNRRRLTVRRSSHLLHRGEPLFGWLAVFAAIGFLSLSSAVVYEGLRAGAVSWFGENAPAGIRAGSTAVLVAVAVAAVAAVVTHAASSSERPLGVFWDVVAFFPRAGHPFAPPCFGERVVPELAARTRAWLGDPSARRRRGVILTAHSMGSTISAATLMAMRGDRVPAGIMAGEELVDRTALLSYGTQLRAYFSRFFPSVFGPDDLGVPGTRGPSLWRSDPWRSQVLAEFRDGLPAPKDDPARSLTGILGAHDRDVPRWRSLWRRTDYLGFPVFGYPAADNPVDRGVTESAPASYLWRIATHSDYLGTEQFLLARDDLVEALGDPAGDAPA